VAIAAALLAGAASAAAETGSASDGDGTKASESKHESTPKSDPETNETTRPTGEQSSTESDSDTTDIGKQETSGSEVQKATRPAPKNNRPHTDEAASRRHPTTATSDTKDATSATEADKPAPSPNETSTTPAESSAAAEPEASAAESTPQQTAVHETETTVAMSARSTVAVTDRTTAPRAPTLVDVVGSIVLNVVMGLIHTFDGAPVLPAGSNVTVRTSTLTIAVAGGRTVEADWYFPNDDETPTRFSYFQHGLGASAPMYSYTAATLAEQTNSIVVAPSLTSNFFDADGAWLGGMPMHQAVADLFVGDREALTESASAAAGYEVTLPTRFVLAGHSLGGSLVMGAAGDMVDNDNAAIADLAGVLLLDSVDVNDTVPMALQKLTGVNYRPVYDISSER